MMEQDKDAPQNRIPVRHPHFALDGSIERHYLGGNVFKTHYLNGFNFLFPEVEPFLIHAINPYLERVQDPQLRAEMKNFCGQETQHSKQHEQFMKVLALQGYRLDGVRQAFRFYHRHFLNRLPLGLRLSMSAGGEHFTAIFAKLTLENGVLTDANPTMREFISWHLMEEMEHKHVAFDVFKKFHPKNYFLRMLGFLLGTLTVLIWRSMSSWSLYLQDIRKGPLTFSGLRKAKKAALKEPAIRALRRGRWSLVFAYFKPGFHPREIPTDRLLNRFHTELAHLFPS